MLCEIWVWVAGVRLECCAVGLIGHLVVHLNVLKWYSGFNVLLVSWISS